MNKLITGSAEILSELLTQLSEERIRQGIRLTTLAEITGINFKRLKKIETLKIIPSMEEYTKIKYVLDTPKQSSQPKISIGDNFFHCPNCANDILYKSSGLEILKEQVSITRAYCSRCGTKLDWSFL